MNPNSPHWPPEAEALLKQLWLDGLSASEIARAIFDRLGLTNSRSAVMGKVRRLNLPRRKKPEEPPKKMLVPAPQKPSRVSSRVFRCSIAPKPPALPAAPLPAPAEAPIDLSSACSILDLKSSSCRWIIGDPKTPEEKIYCGAQIREGYRYCIGHCRMAFQPRRAA